MTRMTAADTGAASPARSPEEHARNWDLRHEDFNDDGFLYDVYAVMRGRGAFAYTDNPFLSTMGTGAWVAVRYRDCYRIVQDWEHFSSNTTPDAAEALGGDLLITLDPPRQQKFRKVVNPYFSPARMKALRPQIRAETDRLIDEFIATGRGDLAQVAWRQPGIVFFKYVLGLPVEDVPLCLELTDTPKVVIRLNLAARSRTCRCASNSPTPRSTPPPRSNGCRPGAGSTSTCTTR